MKVNDSSTREEKAEVGVGMKKGGDSKQEMAKVQFVGPEGKESLKIEVHASCTKGTLRMTREKVTQKEPTFAYPALEEPMDQNWAQGFNLHSRPLQVGEVKASSSIVKPGKRVRMSLFAALRFWLDEG